MATYLSEIEIINQTLSILHSMSCVAERYQNTITLLEERKERSKQNLYRMGVIGVTSSGKSTIINSLLNEDLLPIAVIPSSSQLVSCRKSETRSGVIYFENKSPKALSSEELTPQVIKKYGEEKSNPHNKEKVKQIEISSPNFPLDEDLILVDSPGLDAYGLEGHEQLTLNTLLPSVDFCLFITTCKSNSDSKTRSVLNTIAKYDKPVIVIQNMIDSVKPNLNVDGTIRKTEKEVADEHKNRIRKIIEETKIKSNVEIIQYSAVWARDAQTTNDNLLLKKSGYYDIVSIIGKTFQQLKPKTENKRISFLKDELVKLASEAENDGLSSSVPVGKFEFEGVISDLDNTLSENFAEIKNELNVLSDASDQIKSISQVSEDDISNAKQKCKDCTTNMSAHQKEVFEAVDELCNRLHIPTTQVFNEQCHFPAIMSVPEIKTQTKTRKEWVNKDGLGSKIGRVLGGLFGTNWGKELIDVPYKEIDIQATKQSISDYYKSAYVIYSSSIKQWVECVANAVQRLETEVEKRRAEYEDRINNALQQKVYLEIAQKIKTVIQGISIQSIEKPKTLSKTEAEQKTIKSIPKLSYDISKLAFVVNDKIHRLVFEKGVPQNGNPENIVVGWDSPSLQSFIKYNIGKVISASQNESFVNKGQNYRVFYDINDMNQINRGQSRYANIFILISALQHGQVLNQLVKCHLSDFVRKSDSLYIVVQDFQEILNAQAIGDSLIALRDIDKKIRIKTQPTIMVLNENPIYNLVALETQRRRRQGHTLVQNDEISILSSIQKSSFRSLCSSNMDTRNVVTIIKSLK